MILRKRVNVDSYIYNLKNGMLSSAVEQFDNVGVSSMGLAIHRGYSLSTVCIWF
jgi:hypothetical protein